jgi:alkanesulfonate monooxygenase SsuD/methylene tetrahydromethanopterin reductase-like flavin-dependent oxidoreductase (luciferase family)
MIEATTIMAAMAARTSRIDIGVLVYIVPYRTPLQAAKTFASLDQISEGRIIMGAGLGWSSKEFESLGIEFATRGARFEEGIPLIRRLVAGENVTFHGRFSKLENVQIAPASPTAGRPWCSAPPQSAASRRDNWPRPGNSLAKAPPGSGAIRTTSISSITNGSTSWTDPALKRAATRP